MLTIVSKEGKENGIKHVLIQPSRLFFFWETFLLWIISELTCPCNVWIIRWRRREGSVFLLLSLLWWKSLNVYDNLMNSSPNGSRKKVIFSYVKTSTRQQIWPYLSQQKNSNGWVESSQEGPNTEILNSARVQNWR